MPNSFVDTQVALVLLKILAMGNREIDEGRIHPLKDVIRRLRVPRS